MIFFKRISLIVTAIVCEAFSSISPVTDTVNTGFNNKSTPKAAPLSDGTVVVLGEKKKGAKNLKQFHLKYKTEMYNEMAAYRMNDFAEIELGGKPALAISCRSDIFNIFWSIYMKYIFLYWVND